MRYSKMGMADVRFGSKVDIVPCGTDVRFTPNSDRMLRCRKVSLSAISDQSAPHKKMQTQTLISDFPTVRVVMTPAHRGGPWPPLSRAYRSLR